MSRAARTLISTACALALLGVAAPAQALGPIGGAPANDSTHGLLCLLIKYRCP